MSFNELPNETLQLIVDKCAEADQANRAGKEGNEIRGGNSKKQQLANDWKGRSCRAISLVNRDLRSMAMKHIFRTLSVSRISPEAFKFFSPGSQAAACVTKVNLPENLFLPDSVLSRIVLKLLPRLPNLAAIKGLTSSQLTSLIGPLGLSRGPDPSEQEPEQVRAQEILLEVAGRISGWDIDVEEEDFRALVDANTLGIKRLRLVSPDLFTGVQEAIPEILGRLSNLNSLSIQQDAYHDGFGDYVDHIVDSVFDTPFSFAHNLRSLDLNFTGFNNKSVTTDLKFAALFPSIQRLVVNCDDRNPWETSGQQFFHFPQLEYLRVKNLHFGAISNFFEDLDLPSILEIEFDSLDIEYYEPSYAEERMCHPLDIFSETLRKVTVSNTSGFDSSFPHDFATSLPSIILELDFFSLASLDPAPAKYYETPMHPHSPPLPSSPCGDPFRDRLDNLVSWVRERAEKVKGGGDLTGERDLIEALQSIDELKTWLEA